MSDRLRRAALWLLMGFATGLAAGMIASAVSDAPLFGRMTWLLAVVLAVGFAAAEYARATRRRPQ